MIDKGRERDEKDCHAVLLFCCCCCGFAAPAAEDGYRLIVATDLHYLAPDLTDHGAAFTPLTESGDGKLMRRSRK